MCAKLDTANPEAPGAIRDAVDEVARGLQHEARNTSQRFVKAMRDANHTFIARPSRGQRALARACAGIHPHVIASSKLGRFSVNVVERALLDKDEHMILVLAKAVGYSWITVKELLLMYVAERNPQPDELTRTFERCNKLARAPDRRFLRTARQSPKGDASAPDITAGA